MLVDLTSTQKQRLLDGFSPSDDSSRVVYAKLQPDLGADLISLAVAIFVRRADRKNGHTTTMKLTSSEAMEFAEWLKEYSVLAAQVESLLAKINPANE